MRLKELIIQLASKPLPAEIPAKAVWLINCSEKKGVDFAGEMAFRPASYAHAECELADEFRPYDRSEERNDYFIGSTAYLAGCVAHLSCEEIDRDWESICMMMNW